MNETGYVINRRFMASPLLRFEVQLSEHCNLNCRNCLHYSPIAKEEFLDLDTYEKDISRLSELFSGEAEWIRLMGGEPLLNPDICRIMELTREYFPYGHISIVTNGIMLSSMKEVFWTCCRDNRIEIWMTMYPIKLDYNKLLVKIKEKDIIAGLYGEGMDRSPTMYRFPIDIHGDFDPVERFYNCPKANICLTLRNGRLYPCATSAHAHHLVDYYSLPISASLRNGVDIYGVKDAEELMNKVATPKPFCRYCDYSRYEDYADEWAVSKRYMYDWVSFTWSERDIIYLKRSRNVYVFGAGNWGRCVLDRLLSKRIEVKSIIVTKTDDNPHMIHGVDVVGIDEVRPSSDDVCIIAISGAEKISIQRHLVSKGFENIIPVMKL